jgi:hypothetical protein
MNDDMKEALLLHLKAAWERNYNKRSGRPFEIGEWFYGMAPEGGSPELRDMRKLYAESYMDGAVDMLEAVLDFDGDIRGAEALAALSHSMLKGDA